MPRLTPVSRFENLGKLPWAYISIGFLAFLFLLVAVAHFAFPVAPKTASAPTPTAVAVGTTGGTTNEAKNADVYATQITDAQAKVDVVKQQGTAAKPEDVTTAYSGLALAYSNNGQSSVAEANYLTALKASPNDIGAITGLALVYIDEGKKQQAIDTYNRAIAVYGATTDPYELVAIDRWKTAITKLQAGI